VLRSKKLVTSPEIHVKKKERNTVSKKQEEDLSSQNADIQTKHPCFAGVFFSLVANQFVIEIYL
jgi:hypothetical protein